MAEGEEGKGEKRTNNFEIKVSRSNMHNSGSSLSSKLAGSYKEFREGCELASEGSTFKDIRGQIILNSYISIELSLTLGDIRKTERDWSAHMGQNLCILYNILLFIGLNVCKSKNRPCLSLQFHVCGFMFCM